MTTRREFLLASGASLITLGATTMSRAQQPPRGNSSGLPLIDKIVAPGTQPAAPAIVVSTWHHGRAANAAAWQVLAGGGQALDAVETGVRVTEADPTITSVGYGGLPDRDGHVTLDACIMNELGNAGSVAFLENIKHPISVARAVMEKTPHVMLVGAGAQQFAASQGFPTENLLTPEARQAWLKWSQTHQYNPWPGQPDPSRHDTIGQLALDQHGNLSGACTTSGLAFKMHGRVGDSPIIGAALYVDNEVGAACATGVGEEVMKTVGSFLIVELMRQGLSPAAACVEAIDRIAHKNPQWRDLQVGYLALDRGGNVGAYALGTGFQYAVQDKQHTGLVDVDYRAE